MKMVLIFVLIGNKSSNESLEYEGNKLLIQQFWTFKNMYPKIKYFRGLILLEKI